MNKNKMEIIRLKRNNANQFERFNEDYFLLNLRGLMSYLGYLCFVYYSGVQHILCCGFFFVFVCFFRFSCCQFLWIVHS